MWLSKDHQRFFMTGKEHPLPLFIESIGENNNQEPIERAAGYPCYHWLQTVDGEGAFSFEGRAIHFLRGRESCLPLMCRTNIAEEAKAGLRYILHSAVPRRQRSYPHWICMNQLIISGK